MVEIWRWPKASLKVSTMVCMEMPSRPAVSRSTSTFRRKPSFCASEATSCMIADERSFCASFDAQSSTSCTSVPVSVY